MSKPSPLMTVAECAKYLGIDPRTVTALVETGRWCGAEKVGRRYVISRAAVMRLYRDGITDDPAPIRTAETSTPFLRRVG